MTEPGPLFDPAENPALARRTDPATSHAAAAGVTPMLGQLQQQVLDALKAAPGGLTTYEIGEITGIERDTVSPRLPGLVKAGLVIDSGETRIPAGRKRAGIVWRAA